MMGLVAVGLALVVLAWFVWAAWGMLTRWFRS